VIAKKNKANKLKKTGYQEKTDDQAPRGIRDISDIPPRRQKSLILDIIMFAY
jgi:hypothetical protein